MERTYELTAEDLIEVQAQLLAARRERLRTSVWPIALATLLAGVLAWPLAAVVLHQPVFGIPATRAAVRYLLLLGLAGGLIQLFKKRLRISDRPSRRAAENLGRVMARRSVLGPIQLRLDDEGLTRTNSAGTVRVSRTEIAGVLESPWGLTVHLKRKTRVIPIPARAHPSPEAARQFREALEALREPVQPLPRRAVRPGLLLLLGYSAFVLAAQQALGWYNDPRRSNPAEHVVLYGTSWCPVCAKLRKCLRRDRVPFEDVDVEHSQRAYEAWEELGGRGVPTLLVGDQVLYGIQPEALHGALARVGYDVDCR